MGIINFFLCYFENIYIDFSKNILVFKILTGKTQLLKYYLKNREFYYY